MIDSCVLLYILYGNRTNCRRLLNFSFCDIASKSCVCVFCHYYHHHFIIVLLLSFQMSKNDLLLMIIMNVKAWVKASVWTVNRRFGQVVRGCLLLNSVKHLNKQSNCSSYNYNQCVCVCVCGCVYIYMCEGVDNWW